MNINNPPCPFCGGENLYVELYTAYYTLHGAASTKESSFVVCRECGCTGPTAKHQAAAVEDWSIRPRITGTENPQTEKGETENQ